MKKWRKALLWTVACAIAAAAAILLALSLFLGTIAKKGIETVGSTVLGVKVEVESVRISILSGSLTVRGLSIANPEGCNSPRALEVGRIHVDIAPASLLNDKVHIEEIELNGASVSYEQGLSGSNITEIKANIDRFAKSPAQPEEAKQEKAGKPKKFQVDKVSIKNVNVSLSAKALNAPLKIAVPEIEIRDLGKGGDGIDGAELAVELTRALLNGIFKAVRSAAPDISGILDGAGDTAKGVADEIKSGGGKVVDGAKGLVDDVIGIFK